MHKKHIKLKTKLRYNHCKMKICLKLRCEQRQQLICHIRYHLQNQWNQRWRHVVDHS